MINVGIIGAGNIGHTFCQAALFFKEDLCLYAIASRDINKAKLYQDKYSFEKTYGSYQDLYSDPQVDLIYVATPHGLHFEQMMEILDYKKHILCEKAFTLNAHQADLVFKKAKAKQCFVMEAMWTRFLPVIQAIQKEVKDGNIGQVMYIKADFCFKADVQENHRLLNPKLGGGALLDVGIYPITFANLFLGQAQSFSSQVQLSDEGIDLSESIEYHYQNANAHLKASIIDKQPIIAYIYGELAYVVIEGFFYAEKASINNHQKQLIKIIDIPHKVNGFEYEIKEVIDCIHHNKLESQIMSHQDTINILEQMDALRASWKLKYPQEK